MAFGLSWRQLWLNARFHWRRWWETPVCLHAPWNDGSRWQGEAYGVGTWPAFLVALLIGAPCFNLYQTLAPATLDWPGGLWLAETLSGIAHWAYDFADARSTHFAWLPPGDGTEIGFHCRADLFPAHDDPEYEQKRPRMWPGAATLTTLGTTGTTYTVRYDGKQWTQLDGTPIQSGPTC